MRHCLILLLGGLFACAAMAEDSADTRRQLDALNKQIGVLKQNIGQTQKAKSRAARELQDVETEIGKLAAKLHRTRQERDKRQQRLGTLERQQGELRNKQGRQKALIAEQIRSAYVQGREGQLKMLLNQEDPQSLSRLISYYDYVNKARSQQLREYQSTLTALSELIPEIAEETEALSDTEKRLAQQQEQLKVQQQQRERSLAKLDRELSGQQLDLGALDKERKNLEGVLEAIEREITNIAIPDNYRPFKQMRGAMPWPVAGKRLNRFGAPRQGSAIR